MSACSVRHCARSSVRVAGESDDTFAILCHNRFQAWHTRAALMTSAGVRDDRSPELIEALHRDAVLLAWLELRHGVIASLVRRRGSGDHRGVYDGAAGVDAAGRGEKRKNSDASVTSSRSSSATRSDALARTPR